MDEDIKLNKLALLKKAIDALPKEDPPEWEQTLIDGGKELLEEHPTITMEKWRGMMQDYYPLECVDTYGPEPELILSGLERLWDDTRRYHKPPRYSV